MVAEDHRADGQGVRDQRQVDGPVEVVVRVAAGSRAVAHVEVAFRDIELRLVRDVAYGAGLRTTAEQVGTAAAEYRRTQGLEQAPIPEKVMVCLSPRAGMERLVRVGARIAGRHGFASTFQPAQKADNLSTH